MGWEKPFEPRKGVSKDQLVFAEQVQHDVHLERLKLADLFVDTFNVTAGATAGDASGQVCHWSPNLGKANMPVVRDTF